MSPQSYFIVYEPSESLFSFVMHEFNISDILEEPRFVLVLPSMGNDHLLELLTTYTENADRNTICTVLPGYSIDSNFEKVYKQASIENEANSGYHKYMGNVKGKASLFRKNAVDYPRCIEADRSQHRAAQNKNGRSLCRLLVCDFSCDERTGNEYYRCRSILHCRKAPVYLNSSFTPRASVISDLMPFL